MCEVGGGRGEETKTHLDKARHQHAGCICTDLHLEVCTLIPQNLQRRTRTRTRTRTVEWWASTRGRGRRLLDAWPCNEERERALPCHTVLDSTCRRFVLSMVTLPFSNFTFEKK
jgi:hypothetical protein